MKGRSRDCSEDDEAAGRSKESGASREEASTGRLGESIFFREECSWAELFCHVIKRLT